MLISIGNLTGHQMSAHLFALFVCALIGAQEDRREGYFLDRRKGKFCCKGYQQKHLTHRKLINSKFGFNY